LREIFVAFGDGCACDFERRRALHRAEQDVEATPFGFELLLFERELAADDADDICGDARVVLARSIERRDELLVEKELYGAKELIGGGAVVHASSCPRFAAPAVHRAARREFVRQFSLSATTTDSMADSAAILRQLCAVI